MTDKAGRRERLEFWRTFVLQITTTIMIPLTVAGIGWYYTRWQQNVADLKTMIDLVTDEKAEKRKYGVAMFEYLLKNDKVPVEFLLAQLAFANSAADRELLPLMEAAVQNAAKENEAVAAAYKIAQARLPARVFVHVRDLDMRRCAASLFEGMKDADKATVTVASYALVPDYGAKTHELRYFKPADREAAERLAAILSQAGAPVEAKDLGAYAGVKDSRPNTFELWFGQAALPPACTRDAG